MFDHQELKKTHEDDTFEEISKILVNHLERMKHYLKKQDGSFALTLGLTGSGKSTLITALSSKPNLLELKKIGGIPRVVVKENSPTNNTLPSIGHSQTSETSLPEFYNVDEHKWKIVDCAGFNDTRGRSANILTSTFTQMTIHNLNNILAIIIVIDYNDFHGNRGQKFQELVDQLNLLFPDIEKIKDHLIFVINRAHSSFSPSDDLPLLIASMQEDSQKFSENKATGDDESHEDWKQGLKRKISNTQQAPNTHEKAKMLIAHLMDLAFHAERVHVITNMVDEDSLKAIKAIRKSIDQQHPLTTHFKVQNCNSDWRAFERFLIQQATLSENFVYKANLEHYIESLEFEKADIHNKIQILEKEKIATEEFKQEHEHNTRPVLKHMLRETRSKIRMIQDQFNLSIARITQANKKLQSLNTDDPVFYFEDEFSEKRNWFSRLFGLSSEHTFQYGLNTPDLPILKYEEDYEQGALTHKKVTPRSYTSLYRTNSGENARAVLTIYVQKKLEPENSQTIKKLREHLKDYDRQLENLKKQLKFLHKKIDILQESNNHSEEKYQGKQEAYKLVLTQLNAISEHQEDRKAEIDRELEFQRNRQKAIDQILNEKELLFKLIYAISEHFLKDSPTISRFRTVWETHHMYKGNLKNEEEKLFDAYLCPIGHTLMKRPVTTSCRHSFEEEILLDYLSGFNLNPEQHAACPCCQRLTVSKASLKHDTLLQSKIRAFTEQIKKRYKTTYDEDYRLLTKQIKPKELGDILKRTQENIKNLKEQLTVEEEKLKKLENYEKEYYAQKESDFLHNSQRSHRFFSEEKPALNNTHSDLPMKSPHASNPEPIKPSFK